MEDFNNRCFVCKTELVKNESEQNTAVNLPVCNLCKGTDKEKQTEKEYLSDLAEGFVCGCI